ncbi:cyclophilin-like fold protein [Syntrophorhabdus aromaticivorans]|uniref:Cyclophilin TM1367-like domain-containing protein n=1 Tax=Syntrophorhabdus aromaticivorans TaxID=328301 RepID=A0A351U5B7_9BACT|nr:cyclophilin-like fold protein [Syntrophorhabdus aromaticivorans]NLW34859.1 hypothetical protein [Syntrophorhabdus aromaticivorans]HBA55148.1 hypothetical protein [Syntrophorhabdus aromaticivorans]
MHSRVRVVIGTVTIEAEFFDSACARAIVDSLPLESRPNRWGDEFYFEIPVRMALDETATTGVKAGDIGYWPPGNALAIFFGPTPLSRGDDPVPAGEVNIVGRIVGDAKVLKKAAGASAVRIEKAS